jgi:DNA mismatch endonuclease, patch repair protein
MESPAVRRKTMQAVKSKNTGPEMEVRRLLHAAGYRYRLHRRDLPGSPDLVFVGRRKVIFVHGCFWHGHNCERGARIPKTNAEYWIEKVARNRGRDEIVLKQLQIEGWESLTLWECQLKTKPNILRQLRSFLGRPLRSSWRSAKSLR